MSNQFPFPKAAQTALLSYFFEVLDAAMSSSGCNDMDQAVFSKLSDKEKIDLFAGFLKWDKQANPDGWEPKRFENISDFEWLAYLRERFFK